MAVARTQFKIQNSKFKMIKVFILTAFSFIIFLAAVNKTFGQSDYVLPYPSSMPGGLPYKLHLFYELVSKYCYFGDFGQFDYNLKMADKYLVEAKTLFEYKQYLLGYSSLQKSDRYFIDILSSLDKARERDKNIAGKRLILREASQKHIEVLQKMEMNTPDTFLWQPEKTMSTELGIKKALLNSILLRKNNL